MTQQEVKHELTQIEIKTYPGNNDFKINSMKLFGIKLKEVQVIEKKRLQEKVYKKVVDLYL